MCNDSLLNCYTRRVSSLNAMCRGDSSGAVESEREEARLGKKSKGKGESSQTTGECANRRVMLQFFFFLLLTLQFILVYIHLYRCNAIAGVSVLVAEFVSRLETWLLNSDRLLLCIGIDCLRPRVGRRVEGLDRRFINSRMNAPEHNGHC